MKLRLEESRELFNYRVINKVLKFHGHEKITDKETVDVVNQLSHKDYYCCNSCDNCNGIRCSVIKVPKSLVREVEINKVLTDK